MTTKEFFQKAYYIKCLIKSKRETINNIRYYASLGTSQLSATRLSGTNNHSKVEKIINAVDLESEMQKDIEKLWEAYAEISKAIKTLDNPLHAALLSMRYLNNDSWGKIANVLKYNEAYVTGALHDRALKEAENNMRIT